MSLGFLPTYSTTTLSLPPSYSTEPLADEETVAYTPRAADFRSHGTFVKKWNQATIIFKDQDENARLPTYGRGGRIIGELELSNTGKIIKVTLKLSGHMSLSGADTGSMGINLLDETQVLWEQGQQHLKENRCPSILPFFMQIPGTYEFQDKTWRLPPTYEATFLNVPALFVRCMYTLSITVTRARAYWTTSKRYMTLINHRPRVRPQRPIVLLDSVFGSIKPVPDEWTQVMGTMHTRNGSGMRAIECHLFVPSTQTFAITDTIPIHLQLCSSLKSFRELLPPTSSLLHTTPPERYQTPNEVRSGTFAIRLSIARQIVVDFYGRRRFRTFTLGVGKLWPVPPVMNAAKEDTEDVWFDWQGEVKCWGEVLTGGFGTSHLLVKDFLVLAMTPPNPRSSFLLPMQISHAIRLVSDSWVDVDAAHPQDL